MNLQRICNEFAADFWPILIYRENGVVPVQTSLVPAEREKLHCGLTI